MPKSTRRIPEGMHTVTPHLTVRGAAAAIDYYKKALGAEEIRRMPGPDGASIMFAELKIGDSRIYLNDEFPQMGCKGPQTLNGSPVTIHLYVEDVDAVFNRAVAAGAKPVMPVQDMFWGDRYGMQVDPFGHQWSIASHVEDPTPQEMQERAAKAFSGQGCH